MDFSLITIAQATPINRLEFDQKAYDQSANRTEERKVRLRALWTRCCVQIGVAADGLHSITKIASVKRAG